MAEAEAAAVRATCTEILGDVRRRKRTASSLHRCGVRCDQHASPDSAVGRGFHPVRRRNPAPFITHDL